MASTDLEQMQLELINEARLDPLGNAMRYISSFAPLTATQQNIQDNFNFWGVNGAALLSQLQALQPRQPLAWNDSLANAARTHNQAMIAANQQSHQLPGESDPGTRMAAAGYAAAGTFYWGENIFAAGQDSLHIHAGFMVDWGSGPNGMQSPPGHRYNIMGVDENPQQPIASNFREIGIGVTPTAVQSNVGPLAVTQDFGGRGNTGVFVLGVAYNDNDNNGFYSLGEGASGLSVTLGAANGVSGTSGGYSLQSSSTGAQSITLTGAGLAGAVTFSTTLADGQNIKLDIVGGNTLQTSVSGTISGPVSVVRGLGIVGLSLTTDAGAQVIFGTKGNDTLNGGADNDQLNGRAGADTMIGGSGNDYFFVDNIGDIINENANPAVGGTNDRVFTSVSYALAAGVGVETLQTTNNALTTALVLTGNEFANTIIGNAGNNTLNGGAGADALFGMGGNDTYYVDSPADQVNEDVNPAIGGSNDQVLTTVNYTLKADSGVETLRTTNNALATPLVLTGNGFANTIVGNAGNNTLNGGGGTDTLFGMGGNDTYIVDTATDQVNEDANPAVGGTNDRVLTTVNYGLKAGSGVETLQTTDNTLTTPLALTGNEFANTIIGNAGANTLNGAGGKDTLFGLDGSDRFVFNTALNTAPGTAFGSLPTTANVDFISDFNPAADTILLDDAIFTALASTPAGPGGIRVLAAGAYHTGAVATQADDRIVYNPSTGALIYDADGSGGGAAFEFAVLKTNLALTNADFWVI